MSKNKSIYTDWLIVARSSNRNSFGLFQYVLVNRQGDAYTALKSAVLSVNSVLQAHGANFGLLGFECLRQISEKMPLQALSDAWALAGEPEKTIVQVQAKRKPAAKMPDVTEIMAYENGEMDEQTLIDFFQRLIDTGMAWTLQGCYGRQAARLIEAGLCHK